MTVIASFVLGDVPLVFADLLLTGPRNGEPQATAVPAIGDVQEFFGNSGWAVSGLRQKITVISPECVIAWAGSYLGARIAISALKELAKRGLISSVDVLNYLNQETELKRHPASFVGFTLESGVVHQFGFEAERYDSPTLGAVSVSGSGAPVIREFSAFLGEMEWKYPKSNIANPTLDAVARTLMLGGLLLQSEFRGHAAAATILNMFGGGYEIAVLADGRFQKVADLTYVFWYARVAPTGVDISRPVLIIKQQYLREHLLIRAVHLGASPNDSGSTVRDDQRHSIRPMHTTDLEPTVADLSTMSLQSPLFCHCVVASKQESFCGVYTLIENYGRIEDAKMVIEDRGCQVMLNIRQDLLATIAKTLHSFLSAPSASSVQTS